jgi:hypothetical protein
MLATWIEGQGHMMNENDISSGTVMAPCGDSSSLGSESTEQTGHFRRQKLLVTLWVSGGSQNVI